MQPNSQHNFLFLVIAVVLAIEISVTVVVYRTFIDQEQIDKQQLLEQTNRTLANNIVSSSKNYLHDVSKKSGFFRQVRGRFISPNDFHEIVRSDLAEIPVFSERWIPYVNGSERVQFETFYNQYYDNFTIKDISFTDNEFIISSAPDRPFYYPFALSIPPFTLTPMGGDFYTNSPQFVEILNSPVQPSYSSRVRLSRPNNDIDYGIYLQSFVHDNIGNPLGVSSILIVPSENVQQILQQQQINNNLLKYYIFDNRIVADNIDNALIYRPPSSLPVTGLKYLTSQPDTYTITVEPLLYIFVYDSSYADSVESSLPIVVAISFAVMSFLIDILIITGYIFYRYRLQSVKNLTYREMLDFVNHELRNPLNVMIGSVSFLIQKLKRSADGIDNHYLINKLVLCENQCNLMIYIIERVKGMKMLIEGKNIDEIANLEPSEIILEDLVNVVNAIIQGRIEEHGFLDYNVEYLCKRNLKLYADKNRMVEVLLNILVNAVKYSKLEQEGKIELVIELHDGNLIFKVSDTGIGIPLNMDNKLFKPYVRVSNKNDVSGSGLGLYYCKLICEKMEGSIGYTSQLGVGTTFTVSVPYKESNGDNDDDEFSILNMNMNENEGVAVSVV